MDDTFGVSRGQCARHLRGAHQGLSRRERPAPQASSQRLAFHQFHHQVRGPHVVDGADVRMIQLRDCPGFALEAFAELFSRNLDGHLAMQAGVGGAKDASHTAVAQRFLNPVRTQERRRRVVTLGHNRRQRFIQQAGRLTRGQHPLHFLAHGWVHAGQQGRAIGGALFDRGKKPLNFLPSLGGQGDLPVQT